MGNSPRTPLRTICTGLPWILTWQSNRFAIPGSFHWRPGTIYARLETDNESENRQVQRERIDGAGKALNAHQSPVAARISSIHFR